MTSSILEPSKQIPVIAETDVVVCGGGPAGIAAALGAASAGARTVLLEVGGCLGGIWTSGLLSYLLDPKPGNPTTALLIAELETNGGKNLKPDFEKFYAWSENSFFYNPEIMKLVLERLAVRFGIRVQLHTRVCAVTHDATGKKIESVLTESKSGRQAWTARVFIDATGDGDLAHQAGCRYAVGRPDSGEVQPLTLMGVVATPYPDRVMPLTIGKVGVQKLIASLGIKLSYGAPILIPIRSGLFAFMMNHHYASAFDAAEITQATIEAREEMHRAVEQLRQGGGACEGLCVAATAAQIGVREGRRIRGRYEVTVDDAVAGRVQPDGICRVTFPIDVHSTKKHGGEAFDPENKIKMQPYDIPLRALIAEDQDNLLMAGRCISGDFLAHSSYRVTGNSVATGEAAGFLAARAVADKIEPHQCPWERYQETARRGAERLLPQK